MKTRHRAKIFALLFTLILASQYAFAQTTATPVSYSGLLSDSAARQRSNQKLDEVQEALSVISAGGQTISAGEVTTQLKKNYPAIQEGAVLRVLPEMRETVVYKGSDYEHLVMATSSLLKFCGLDGKVVPILYRSEQPVVALSYPNALIFSTRALDLLNDNEIEAIAAHELGHLIGHDVFRQAIDDRDNRTLRLLELFYDGSAAAILQAMGKNPRSLISGLYKQQQVLELEYGEQDRKGQNHPTMSQRERLNKELIRQFALFARR